MSYNLILKKTGTAWNRSDRKSKAVPGFFIYYIAILFVLITQRYATVFLLPVEACHNAAKSISDLKHLILTDDDP